ncbi:LANO_0E11540g1_1 [Lachancea nothofagi CBS 11611]|uniref:LANO_0E11540g1_1 n=1 Tax=Lachancea nothofagi CBS 11611 TaxID=1266666 RepID=A0A1G4JXR8_9SACH|nr:LANO_0E11540g1_1 [Lachancea nothofagi CBS 11611]
MPNENSTAEGSRSMNADGSPLDVGKSQDSRVQHGKKEGLPGAYAPGSPESQPLLNGDRARASHRSIGQNAAEGNLVEEVESLQGRMYKTRQRYHIFVQDSKIVLNTLIGINLVWLVTTFIVDFFFNIGLLHFSNRLTSFNDLCLIFISIVANTLNLWSNKVGLYSRLDQGLNIVLCLMTLFNLFLTLIISYTRRRIGFIGAFTYLWASLTFFAGAVLDWYLYYYFKEFNASSEDYDETPTSEGNSRHTIKEWVSIGVRNSVKCLIFVFYVFFTLNTLLFTIDVGSLTRGVKDVTTEASASYDAFHWVDKEHTYQLHITCYGDLFAKEKDAQPIVLFDHGSLDTAFLSATWIQELYHLNRVDRYCTYERPGYGLSDSAPAPVSIAMVADALTYALVEDAKIKGPFSVVGYDIGGLYAQVFTAKNLDKVESMLLVESWHEDILLKNYLQRLLPPDKDNKDPDDVSNLPVEIKRHNGFKLWWQGIWSTLGIKLQTSWLLAHHGSKERLFGRDLQYQGKFIRSKFLESVTSSLLSYKDVLNGKEKLRDIKLSVASSNQLIKKSPQWGNWQRDLTKLSAKTQEWKILNGGHEVYKYGSARKELQDVLLRLLGDKDRY